MLQKGKIILQIGIIDVTNTDSLQKFILISNGNLIWWFLPFHVFSQNCFLHISWLVYSLCCVRISFSFERKFKFLKRLLSGKTFVLSCRWLCLKVESNVMYLCIRILCYSTSKEKQLSNIRDKNTVLFLMILMVYI